MRSLVMKKKRDISKLVQGCVFLVGLVCISINVGKLQNVFLSIGSSLIATAVASFLLDLAQEHDISEVYKLAKDTYNDLSRFTETLNVNGRIVPGRHLKEIVPQMVNQELKKNEFLEVDVIGLELYNFWNEQGTSLLKHDKIHIRMIVQDPEAPSFKAMIENEQVSADVVKTNIRNLTNTVRKLQTSLGSDQKVEIRWLYFPAAATITRINEQLYIRTRLIDSAHIDDDNFFEKYVQGERPYNAFRDYFENAWNQWENQQYPTLKEARKHFNFFIATLDAEKGRGQVNRKKVK